MTWTTIDHTDTRVPHANRDAAERYAIHRSAQTGAKVVVIEEDE